MVAKVVVISVILSASGRMGYVSISVPPDKRRYLVNICFYFCMKTYVVGTH